MTWPSSSVAIAKSPPSVASHDGNVCPETLPQYPPQPFCRYRPCQVPTGSWRSKWVCGAIIPCTSQYSGCAGDDAVALAAGTSVEDAIAVGYCGFAARSVRLVITEQLEFGGLMIGLVAASFAESATSCCVWAPAAPPADPSITASEPAAVSASTQRAHA